MTTIDLRAHSQYTVGNGERADHAIRAALSGMVAGDTLEIPAGLYPCQGPINVASGTTIAGHGDATQLTRLGSFGTVFQASSTGDVRFRDFAVDLLATVNYCTAVHADASTGLTVERVFVGSSVVLPPDALGIYRETQHAVLARNAGDVRVRDGRFEHSQVKLGAIQGGTSGAATITGCRWRYSQNQAIACLMQKVGGRIGPLTITDCEVVDPLGETALAYGMDGEANGALGEANDLVCRGLTVRGTWRDGFNAILIRTPLTAARWTFTDTLLRNERVDASGVPVKGQGTTGTRIRPLPELDASGIPIPGSISRLHGLWITGLVAEGCDHHAVTLSGDVDDLVMNGNEGPRTRGFLLTGSGQGIRGVARGNSPAVVTSGLVTLEAA